MFLFWNFQLALQHINEGKSNEFVVKLEDEIIEDPYTDESYNHDSQSLNEKVLNGISGEEVCKLEFNCVVVCGSYLLWGEQQVGGWFRGIFEIFIPKG